MVVKLADNIFSPLGYTSDENYKNIRNGLSVLSLHEDRMEIPEPFVASLFGSRNEVEQRWESISKDAGQYTFFEKISLLSASDALKRAGIDASSDRVIFILSTTKGNVDALENENVEPQQALLGESARKIAGFFGNKNTPAVVSNACISGACAQLLAYRLLEAKEYDFAVVIGADVQSKFIVTGFQSFKALSKSRCKPFDIAREGLNLGEAAAAVVYSFKDEASLKEGDWILECGAVHNDANHISGPSRTGEGCYRSLRDVADGIDVSDIAFINAHGTATLYNDEMESIAIERAGLADVPVNGYKGVFGHTMGAAGVLETIISQKSLDDNIVLGTRGFEEIGVSRNINIAKDDAATQKKAFIKILSGFGGCNIALRFRRM